MRISRENAISCSLLRRKMREEGKMLKMLQEHRLTSTWFRARLRTQREHSCSRAPKARARKILGKSSIFTAKNALNQARNGFADLLPPPPPPDLWFLAPPDLAGWGGGDFGFPPPETPSFGGERKPCHSFTNTCVLCAPPQQRETYSRALKARAEKIGST